MKARTYQEMTDHIIDQIRRMQISLDDKMSLVGMLTALQTRHEMDISNASNASNTLKALEKRCPFCGGKLSPIRKNNGRKYCYCFGCFNEYEVKDDA